MALIGILLLCFYSAISTLSAQLATKYLLSFKPSFKNMFLLTLSSLLASASLGIIINYSTSTSSNFQQESAFLSLVTLLLIRFLLFAKFVKHPENGAIGEKNSFKVVLFSAIIEILLFLAIGFVLMALFNVSR